MEMQDLEEQFEAALMADVVIVVAGTSSTEMTDRDVFPEQGWRLYGGMDELIARVAKERPTVVLLETPGVVMMPWLDSVSAVANLFLAGEDWQRDGDICVCVLVLGTRGDAPLLCMHACVSHTGISFLNSCSL